MYDKYFIVNPITTDGNAIPKHKGIMINNPGSLAGNTFYFKNASGNTISVYLSFPGGNNSIVPIQAYGMPVLTSGLTAFYLN